MRGRGKPDKEELYDFSAAVRGKKLPLLILDEKWLGLFELDRMPKEVNELQNKLRKLIVKQGKLNEEISGLKRYKSQLLQEIVENMGIDETTGSIIESRKMDKNQKMVLELNEKIAVNEEILDGLPEEMQRVNEDLLIASSNICYAKLHEHTAAVRELDEEIRELSEVLMAKTLEKQGHEEDINRMYTYMHNMYGPELTEVLDFKNGT